MSKNTDRALTAVLCVLALLVAAQVTLWILEELCR